MMCFVVAKHVDQGGCVALRARHGKALVDLKRGIRRRIGYTQIELVTISKPSAFPEYAPYHVVETEGEFKEAVDQLEMPHENQVK